MRNHKNRLLCVEITHRQDAEAEQQRWSRISSQKAPAPHAVRSLLALKLFGAARNSHLMSYVFDEGLTLFAGLNVVPKRSFLTEYSCRVSPEDHRKLM